MIVECFLLVAISPANKIFPISYINKSKLGTTCILRIRKFLKKVLKYYVAYTVFVNSCVGSTLFYYRRVVLSC